MCCKEAVPATSKCSLLEARTPVEAIGEVVAPVEAIGEVADVVAVRWNGSYSTGN